MGDLDFDEFVARSDSFRDDCTKRDRDHGGECSDSNFFVFYLCMYVYCTGIRFTTKIKETE